jgi:tetratricopeptide repeat protein 30
MFTAAAPLTGLWSIPEGKMTETIYGLIKEQRHAEVVKLISGELQNFPKSRAALSILAYCYYQVQDFHNATQWCVYPPPLCGHPGFR